MYKNDYIFLLEDILISIKKIKKYTFELDFNKFINDDKTMDAVVRNFEIIGEISSKFDDDFKSKYSVIEWKRMKNLRNRMIHDYSGIDYEIVWEIIQNYLDELEFQIEKLLEK